MGLQGGYKMIMIKTLTYRGGIITVAMSRSMREKRP
ncbi:hypothetical protein SPV1_06649 [Mariprofundus ferrooxydans PV-1]|uniref:Uncharacterized protein n=1 Tax=Mariprofundus ferrooxydans PV-1 TaxID=314345 RepID=Q0F0M7_9PROT|nr:hypothetical protein SPV1_06649 [Mariprofundus ferrooxydans PV-1]